MVKIKVIDFIRERMGRELSEEKLIAALKKENLTYEDIAKIFGVPLQVVKNTIALLQDKKVLLEEGPDGLYIKEFPNQGGEHKLNPEMWDGDRLRFGYVSDNHLGSNFAREDVLHLAYDTFAREGIPLVFHTGNMIEGEARFNKNELNITGLGRQASYAASNYPYRPGIQTKFITADDHEGWYTQREGINMGEYIQMLREQMGMNDFEHLGYVEADINLNAGKFENPCWLRLFHPGGGTAYAISYAPQKIVESYQPGEKPHILFIGHYHKGMYMLIRGVHTFQTMCTCDQSIYMRKNKIEAVVGYGFVEIRINNEGVLSRVDPAFFQVFDKGFYTGKDKYWKIG